ncbi:trypsin-like peptidase domain-containing protein [Variovorax sp. GB1P17]|uniref:trypsin-like peptidase domain-containing protein n=1 Tax=Variovorax sp. GB1P17 TaxID=3443740 RepID=UPI003F462B90
MPIATVGPATLFVEISGLGNPLGSATGFIYCKNDAEWFLLTNRHVVTGRHNETGTCLDANACIPDTLHIHHHNAEKTGWVVRTESLYHDADQTQPRWIEHPSLGPRADFVALPLKNLANTQTLSWGIDEVAPVEQQLAPAMPISVVGFPFGISYAGRNPIWATGFVATEPSLDFDDLPLLLVDCRARPGQSGSPVVKHVVGQPAMLTNGTTQLAYSGTLFIGIYSGRINEKSDLGFVWKRSAVIELLKSL